jgi:hypothetical protein
VSLQTAKPFEIILDKVIIFAYCLHKRVHYSFLFKHLILNAMLTSSFAAAVVLSFCFYVVLATYRPVPPLRGSYNWELVNASDADEYTAGALTIIRRASLCSGQICQLFFAVVILLFFLFFSHQCTMYFRSHHFRLHLWIYAFRRVGLARSEPWYRRRRYLENARIKSHRHYLRSKCASIYSSETRTKNW